MKNSEARAFAVKLLALLALTGALVSNSARAQARNPAADRLRDAHVRLLKLSTKLPIEPIIGEEDREAAKRTWRNSVASIESIIARIETEQPGKLAQELRTTVRTLRKLGLYLPFHAAPRQDETVREFLSVINLFESITKEFGQIEPVLLWKAKGLVWRKLDARLPWREAQKACEELLIPGSVDWHLPTLREFNLVTSELGDPILNPIFGGQVSQWGHVWTSTSAETDPTKYRFVNLQKKEWGEASILTPGNVICAGREPGASPAQPTSSQRN